VILGCSTSARADPPNYPTRPIELKYYADGPWAVTARLAGACCDSSGNKFDLYYPTNLGAHRFKHPILTWGNGTKAKPGQYDYLLKHLASWGFVIVATKDQNTGPGQTILDAANYMIGENSNSSSLFAGRHWRDQRDDQIERLDQDRHRDRTAKAILLQQQGQLCRH
jgi:predicted dienelactone hydrolase